MIYLTKRVLLPAAVAYTASATSQTSTQTNNSRSLSPIDIIENKNSDVDEGLIEIRKFTDQAQNSQDYRGSQVDDVAKRYPRVITSTGFEDQTTLTIDKAMNQRQERLGLNSNDRVSEKTRSKESTNSENLRNNGNDLNNKFYDFGSWSGDEVRHL